MARTRGKLRAGVIGTGMGRYHMEAYAAHPDAELVAVCDLNVEEARSFGITGTPGFLVNGRLIKGAQPFEAFEEVIDDELRRKGLPVPKPAEKTDAKVLPDSDDPREAPRAVD